MLAVGVLVYPVMATDVRLDDRFNGIGPGIDGEAYMEDAVYRNRGITLEFATDRPGIEWLRNHVEGAPVVVEAQWDLYTWANRISIYTGLPTISRLGLAPDTATPRVSLGGPAAARCDQQFLHDQRRFGSAGIPRRIWSSVRLRRRA